jgi:hypothetical protein
MSETVTIIHDVQILICALHEKKLVSEADAIALIGDALYHGTELIVIPVERLEDDFFQLKTGLAGQILQKFVTYRRRLVILGDVSQHIAQSRAFKDFVYEANHGNQIWFVASLQELSERLNPKR